MHGRPDPAAELPSQSAVLEWDNGARSARLEWRLPLSVV